MVKLSRDECYQLLGVKEGDDDAIIQKAYKKLALQWHPDKNPDNKGEATIKFQGIYNAYTRLTQEESSEEEDFEDYNEDPYDAAAQFFSRFFGNMGHFPGYGMGGMGGGFGMGGAPGIRIFSMGGIPGMDFGMGGGGSRGYFDTDEWEDESNDSDYADSRQQRRTQDRAQWRQSRKQQEQQWRHNYKSEQRARKQAQSRSSQPPKPYYERTPDPFAKPEDQITKIATKLPQQLAAEQATQAEQERAKVMKTLTQLSRPVRSQHTDTSLTMQLLRGSRDEGFGEGGLAEVRLWRGSENAPLEEPTVKITDKAEVECSGLEPGTKYFVRARRGQRWSDSETLWGPWSAVSNYVTSGTAQVASEPAAARAEPVTAASGGSGGASSRKKKGKAPAAPRLDEAQLQRQAQEEMLAKQERDLAQEAALARAAADWEASKAQAAGQAASAKTEAGAGGKSKKKKKKAKVEDSTIPGMEPEGTGAQTGKAGGTEAHHLNSGSQATAASATARVEQAVQSQRWMRHHMALGLRGQALAEAVQMSIVMELSMREYEAEAQLRTAAQRDAPAEERLDIPARSAHPEPGTVSDEADGQQASLPPSLKQQQWNGSQSELAAGPSQTHSLAAPASGQPSYSYRAERSGAHHSASYPQGQEGFGTPDGSNPMWRKLAEQTNHEGFGAPVTSARHWERQQEEAFEGPLGPTPQQKMPAEQQPGAGMGRQPAPAFEWEPAAEHQAGWQQQERPQPDGGAHDRGRLHEHPAEGWGQPGPPQQQQQSPPQALRASKPRPGGQRDRQNGAEQREHSAQPPSQRHGGAWDAGNQPSAGPLSGQDNGWPQPALSTPLAPAGSSKRSPLPQPFQQRSPSPPGWRSAPQPQPQQHQQEPLNEPKWQAETSRSAAAASQQDQQQLEQGWEAGRLQQAPAVAAPWQQQQSQVWEAEQMYPSQPLPAVEGGWGEDQFASRPQLGSNEDRWGGEPQQGSQGGWAQPQQPAVAGQAEAGWGAQQPAPQQWQHQHWHGPPAGEGWQAGGSAPQPGGGWQEQQRALEGQAQEWGASLSGPQRSSLGPRQPTHSQADLESARRALEALNRPRGAPSAPASTQLPLSGFDSSAQGSTLPPAASRALNPGSDAAAPQPPASRASEGFGVAQGSGIAGSTPQQESMVAAEQGHHGHPVLPSALSQQVEAGAAGEVSSATTGRPPEEGQRQPVVPATPSEQQHKPALRKPAKPVPAEPKPRSKAKKGAEQGVRHDSTEQAQADQPSLQQADDSNAPPGFERGPGRRKKGSTSTEAPAGRQPSAGRSSSGRPPSAKASATGPADSQVAAGKGKAGKGRDVGGKGPAADAAAASAGANVGASSGDATADPAAPANSRPAAGKGKAGKGRDAAGKGPAADAAAAGAGADMNAGSRGATTDSAAPSGQQGRSKQSRQPARVLEVRRSAGPASAEPAGGSAAGEAVGPKPKKGTSQGSRQEVAADEPPPGIPTLPNGRPASGGSPGEAPVPTGRGSLIPQSYASAAPFVPQSLRQQQPAPASAAPQSSHQQLSYHQQHQWHSVPQSTPDALQVPHEEQQQPAAQAAPFVPQAARQQQHQPELQAGPAAPQSSHPQLEQQLPPQGWEPAQAPHHHQHGPANLQAATPAQQLPLPPGQGQVLAGQSIGQPMGQPMGMAGQYMLTQYVAGQSLPTAGQSVAQTMAQSMAQSMGMTVEGMLAYNLAYQEQLRRQQLGARAAAERALKDLQERRQQGLQQGNPQGSAVQGMDGQGVQQRSPQSAPSPPVLRSRGADGRGQHQHQGYPQGQQGSHQPDRGHSVPAAANGCGHGANSQGRSGWDYSGSQAPTGSSGWDYGSHGPAVSGGRDYSGGQGWDTATSSQGPAVSGGWGGTQSVGEPAASSKPSADILSQLRPGGHRGPQSATPSSFGGSQMPPSGARPDSTAGGSQSNTRRQQQGPRPSQSYSPASG